MAAKPFHTPSLKRVHDRAKDAMPLVTAFITILGFVATMLETRHVAKDEVLGATQTTTAADGIPTAVFAVQQPTPLKAVFGTATVLARYLIGTLIGLTILATLVLTAMVGGKVWLAVILTSLVLLAIWLASIKFARRYARKGN